MKCYKHINVLYVDDEQHNIVAFISTFRRIFNVFAVKTVSEAEDILLNNEVHVIISDQKLQATTGIKFLAGTLKEYPSASRILVSGYCDKQSLIDAINEAEIYRYIEKPWNYEELEKFIILAYNFHFKNSTLSILL